MPSRRWSRRRFITAAGAASASAAVGHLLQVRFNVRPEVTGFELAEA